MRISTAFGNQHFANTPYETQYGITLALQLASAQPLALAFGEVCTISGESVLERQFDPVLSLKAVISALGAKARQMISDDLTNLTNLWLITFGSASFGSFWIIGAMAENCWRETW
jgi:hypothetical protein